VSQLDVAVTGDLGATLVRSVVVHRQAIDAQTASAIHRVLAVGPRLYARTDHRTAVTELLNLESLEARRLRADPALVYKIVFAVIRIDIDVKNVFLRFFYFCHVFTFFNVFYFPNVFYF